MRSLCRFFADIIVVQLQNGTRVCEDFFVRAPLKNAGVAGSYGEAFEQALAKKDRKDGISLELNDYKGAFEQVVSLAAAR